MQIPKRMIWPLEGPGGTIKVDKITKARFTLRRTKEISYTILLPRTA
jgi:hypothetical protein